MTDKRKPAIRAKKEDYIENIQRINEILLGNGHPEDGLAFRFREFMIDHKIVVADISEIKEGVKGLHVRADENKAAAATAQSAIEKFKLETANYDKGLKDEADKAKIARDLVTTEKRDKRQFFFWIAMAMIAMFALCLSVFKSFDNGKKIDYNNFERAWSDTLKAQQARGYSPAKRSVIMDAIPDTSKEEK